MLFKNGHKSVHSSVRQGFHQAVLILFLTALCQAQQPGYQEADPAYILNHEFNAFKANQAESWSLRPFLFSESSTTSKLWIAGRIRTFYNDDVPNLENTSELWVGKGLTGFASIRIRFSTPWLFVHLEPYMITSQNEPFVSHHVVRTTYISDEIVRKYQVLNDGPARGDQPFTRLSLRESFLYAHFRGLGLGVGNESMWWGPGIHSSLTMSNNTTGFPHITLGTLRSQKFWRVQYDFRYHFGVLDRNIYEPYFSAVLGQVTFPGVPRITLGGSRTFLLGGTATSDDVSWQAASLAPFQAVFKKTLSEQTGESDPYQQDDQTMAFFVTSRYPNLGLILFAEYGWNDHRWDWYDFRAEPDHSGAVILGLRDYGVFGFPQLAFGFEYANLRRSAYYPQRGTPDWYGRKVYDYSTNDSRRFAAHSGSDSDDLYIFLGWHDDAQYLNLSFDYERHGIINSVTLLQDTRAFHFPETKLEVRIDFRQRFSLGWLYAYYEYEYAENLGSPAQRVSPHVDTPVRKANVFGIGFDFMWFEPSF
jgi:hypothetical protein